MLPKPLKHLSRLRTYMPGKPIEEVRRELGLKSIAKLASNENPLGPSPRALKRLKKALPRLHRYPEGSAYELRARLAALWKLPEECFTFGNGSNEILIFAAQAYGGPIAYSERSFAVYEIAAKLFGAREIRVPSPDFSHDLKGLLKASRRAKVLFLCNPNNPTGTWHPPRAIERFLRAVPKSTLVVLDEAYAEFAGQSYAQDRAWLAKFPNLLICRTFSKIYGLAGLRVGYGVASPEICAALEKCRQPFNLNLAAQEAALGALEDGAHVRRTLRLNAKGLKLISATFKRLGIWHLPSKANFIYFREPVPGLYQHLLRQGLIVRPFEPGILRVTLGSMPENRRFLKALERRLAA